MARKTVILEVGSFEIYDDGGLVRIRIGGEDGQDGYTKFIHVAMDREQAERLSCLLDSFANVIQP